MRAVTLNSSWQSEAEVFTDCYAAEYGRIILLSMVGNDPLIKAISSSLLDNRGQSTSDVYVHDGKNWRGKTCLYCDPKANFNADSAKLRTGLTHQLICDERFFRANERDRGRLDEGLRYVLIKPGEITAEIVYQSVIRHLSTPTLPEWSHAIYEEILARNNDWGPTAGRIKEIDAYPEGFTVLSVRVTDQALDEVVSDLVKRRIVGWG
jgi:hypothetical protein